MMMIDDHDYDGKYKIVIISLQTIRQNLVICIVFPESTEAL